MGQSTKSGLFNLLAFALILSSSALFAIQAQTRSPTPDAPRLKNFGQSLKKDSKKKLPDGAANTGTSSANDVDVVRVQTDLIVNDIMVVNNKGEAILGLNQSDFTVSEDAQLQEVAMFSLGDSAAVPRSIVLIIDYSSSEYPFIETSIAAAKLLVDKLKPADRLAVVTDDVKMVVDFTSDKDLLKKSLDTLRQKSFSGTFGQSKQFSALMATLNEMFSREDARPIIIFQTDGDQLEALRGGKAPTQVDFSFADVYRAVEKSRAVIYTVIPGPALLGLSIVATMEKVRPQVDRVARRMTSLTDSDYAQMLKGIAEDRQHSQLAIAGLAKLSGGWHDFLEKPDQADAVYSRILADINNRYIIGYYSRNKERDGKRRLVDIQVKGHPEYTVWGRKAYFAPKE
jgi:VWFA-related protein